MARSIKPIRSISLLCGLVFMGFAIEIVGISNTDGQLHPIHKFGSFPLWLGISAVLLTVLSPALALCSFIFIRTAASESKTPGFKFLLWATVILAVLVALAESMWSCSGHPTWIEGYGG